MRVLFRSLLALVFAGSAANAFASIIVQTTFDTDRQNWSPTFPAATGTGDFWKAAGGNPDGTVRSLDRTGSSTLPSWFFDNATTFNGNRSAALDGSFTFDLRDNGSGSVKTNASFPSSAYDVLISSGSGFLAYTSLTAPTGDSWTSYSLALTAGAGWHFSTNFFTSPPTWAAATEANIQSVLSGITDVQIRGDYWLADETTWLDNVALRSADTVVTPEPASFALLSMGCGAMLMGRKFRCRKARSAA